MDIEFRFFSFKDTFYITFNIYAFKQNKQKIHRVLKKNQNRINTNFNFNILKYRNWKVGISNTTLNKSLVLPYNNQCKLLKNLQI